MAQWVMIPTDRHEDTEFVAEAKNLREAMRIFLAFVDKDEYENDAITIRRRNRYLVDSDGTAFEVVVGAREIRAFTKHLAHIANKSRTGKKK